MNALLFKGELVILKDIEVAFLDELRKATIPGQLVSTPSMLLHYKLAENCLPEKMEGETERVWRIRLTSLGEEFLRTRDWRGGFLTREGK